MRIVSSELGMHTYCTVVTLPPSPFVSHSSNASEVTSDAWMDLGTAVVILILAVLIGEQLVARILQNAPEYEDLDNQSKENRQDENPHEEE